MNIQKCIVFLYTSNERFKNTIKNIIPFTVASKIKSVLNSVKMAIGFPKLIYIFYMIHLNIPAAFSAETDKLILKFLWKCRRAPEWCK